MNRQFLIGLLCLICTFGQSQSTRYGLKLGPSIGFQKWNYFQQDPLYKYHLAGWIENYDEASPYALSAQLGYHTKGSAIRYYGPIQIDNKLYDIPNENFIFNNVSLLLGGKRKYDLNKWKGYYFLGVRGEYTAKTNLDIYNRINEIIPVYPFNAGVKRFLVGFTLSGGMEFPFTELIGGIIELSIQPDITRQYYQPQINNIIDIYNPGRSTTIPERSIKNLSLELSIGIYFTRKVIYVD